MNLKITNWTFALIGAFVVVVGLYLGGSLLAHGAYVSESLTDIFSGAIILLVLVFGGGIIMDNGFEKRSQKNRRDGK